MPQQKKRKSAEEILGITPRAPQRKSAEEILGIQSPAPSPASQPTVGAAEAFGQEVAGGVLEGAVKPAVSLYDAVKSTAGGDFQPLLDIAERAGRGLLQTDIGPGTFGKKIEEAQAPRMAELRQRAEARLPEPIRSMEAGYRQEAAKPRTGAGKVAGVVGKVVGYAGPAVATGILTGGSVPAMAATGAVQSAAEPENLALNVAGAAVPIPVGRVVAPIIRRIRGNRGGAIQREVSEAISGPAAQVRAMGAVAERDAIRASRPTPEEILGITESEIETLAMRGGKAAELRGPRVEEMMALEAGTLVAPAERTPVLETISALRKAGLLTGAKTHLRNIGGTGVFQLGEEAARVPAAIADIAASALTKRRTISGPSLTAMGRSAHEAATKGIREAGEIIRKGPSADDLARLELGAKEIASGSKVVDAYVNGVFRLLNAEDKVFRTYAYRRALEDRARTQVLNEIRRGDIVQGRYGERVRELVDAPSEALRGAAIGDAEIAVFTNDNLVSGYLGKGREFLNQTPKGRLVNFAVDTVMPFTKTPTNIIARMLEYSPVGLGKNLYQVAKGVAKQAFSEAEQRAFAQTFGRATIGTGLMALGWKLYDAGLMTGLYEDEPSKRTRDQAAGRIPGALLIGDTWHQLTGFAPLGNLMAIGAGLAREYEQEREDPSKIYSAMGKVPLRAIGEQPLLEGAADVAKMVAGQTSLGEEAGKVAGSFVPTMVSDVGELIDSQQRESRGQGFLGQVEKRLPGVRQMLPEATDALGRPTEDRLSQMIDPTRSTTARENTEPLMRELVRLDLGLSRVQRRPQEAEESYRGRVKRFGGLYEEYGAQLLNNPQYRRATDEVKKKALESLSNRIKAQLNEESAKGPQRAGNPRERLSPTLILQTLSRSNSRDR